MPELPREPALDSTLPMLMDGYEFIRKRCERHGSDAFIARLMGEEAVCMSGADAARVFYDNDKFRRRDALPKRVQKSLTGEGAVHTLDGAAHQRRKEMFLALMTPERIQRQVDLIVAEWRRRLPDWEQADRVVLFDEAERILFCASCDWNGLPLPRDAEALSADFRAMVDGFGGVGPRHWRGRHARRRGEKWVMSLVEWIRTGELHVPPGSPADIIAHHRDINGALLDTHTAAVEIMNLLRPTVAIAFYIAWVALALHEHPEEREKLRADAGYAQYFVQEVRRFYPFTPFVGARVSNAFDWHGHHFTPGTLVILDVYGTDHDPERWPDPYAFRPERFMEWHGDAFDFIPQGGGDFRRNHRCAGEGITVEVMKAAALLLAREMAYDVPEQDLRYSLSRMPSKPASGFVIGNVRVLDEAAVPEAAGFRSGAAPRPGIR